MTHFAVMDYSLPDVGAKEHWDYPRYKSHWEFPQFSKTVIPYMIATNCEQAEIRLNDRGFLLQSVESYPNRVITGFLPYLPGKVTVIGKNVGVEVCSQEIETLEMAVKLAFETEEQEVKLAYADTKRENIMPYQNDTIHLFQGRADVAIVITGTAEALISSNQSLS